MTSSVVTTSFSTSTSTIFSTSTSTTRSAPGTSTSLITSTSSMTSTSTTRSTSLISTATSCHPSRRPYAITAPGCDEPIPRIARPPITLNIFMLPSSSAPIVG